MSKAVTPQDEVAVATVLIGVDAQHLLIHTLSPSEAGRVNAVA